MKRQQDAEDLACRLVIDKIWHKYDLDGNGYLDKDETKLFIIDSIGEENLEYAEEVFNKVYDTFDADGSGLIDKEEMITFIKLQRQLSKQTDPEVNLRAAVLGNFKKAKAQVKGHKLTYKPTRMTTKDLQQRKIAQSIEKNR